MIRVLIADDHELLRDGLRGMLDAQEDMEVKTHVTRVLNKLGVRDRVQAVVLAYESGLAQAGQDDETYD